MPQQFAGAPSPGGKSLFRGAVDDSRNGGVDRGEGRDGSKAGLLDGNGSLVSGVQWGEFVGTYVWNEAGAIVEANDAFLEVVGYARTDLAEGSLTLSAITPPERRKQTAPKDHARSSPRVSEMIRKDGSRVAVLVGAARREQETGPEACFVIDLSERKSIERRLSESEECLRVLLEEVKDHAFFLLDVEGVVTSWNSGAERATGYSSREAIGQHFSLLYTEEDRRAGKPRAELEVAANEGRYERESRRVRKDGEVFGAEVVITALRRQDGGLRGFSNVVRDVSERERAQEELAYLSHFDQLTGLVNRSLFRDRLKGAIARSEHDERMVALLLIDLDHFKSVNDTLGHDAADALLKKVARRLEGCVREIDTLARLGGDEFGIILENVASVPDVLTFARKILGSLDGHFVVAGQRLMVSASIGVAVFPDSRADRIVSDAGAAMSEAKQAGRNNYQFHTPAMNVRATERTAIETGLKRALEHGAFVLHYQPQIEIATGRLIGAEALIRWQHPDLGLIHPDRFVPLLEETGMIVPAGEWVLQAACRQSRAWRDSGLHVPRVSINVSARQLEHDSFADSVARVLGETGIDPATLGLEITESLLLEDPRVHGAVLAELKSLGLCISIDDFGTGYSSLNYLKRLPLDYLKMDRSFVRDIATDPDHDAIVAAIIGLAHNLRLRVIAEGVETEEQLAFLGDQNCDVAQGFLLQVPLSVAEMTGFLQKSGAIVASAG